MTLTLLSPTAAQLKKLAPVWMRELTRAGLVPGEHVDYSRFLREEATSAAAISTDVDELADSPFIADTGIPNGTSIAVLAEFKGAAALLTADAHAPVIVESLRRLLESRQIKRLPLDVWKVSHHGSRANVSRALLDRLDCRRYVISTNGDHFGHPDREAIARIIKYGGPDPVLLFNYRSPFNEVWASPDLQARYRYTAVYPENGRPGLLVPLLGRQG
jgi:hypothetical protein